MPAESERRNGKQQYVEMNIHLYFIPSLIESKNLTTGKQASARNGNQRYFSLLTVKMHIFKQKGWKSN
ncbi:hypothetical protein HNO89_001688 [Sporosarcina luteola]|nr:hypothetical protein [Sporosarcina luteola]